MRKKIFSFFLIFLTNYFLLYSEEFSVKINGYKIFIEGNKSEEINKVLNSFPLSKESHIEEIVASIDKNLKVEKEFEFTFSAKDNVLTIVELQSEWGRLDLEIKIVPHLINDVIVEYNVEEYPKEWEEKMKKMYGDKRIPEDVIEENRKKTKEEILKKAKEENWSPQRLQRVLELMEKNYDLLRRKIGPKFKLEGGRMKFKLGKIEIFYNNRVGSITEKGKTITFSDVRTIIIERKIK